ncbi:hypothetical protein P4S72_26740 [Vibrio sp. PP-XX7]
MIPTISGSRQGLYALHLWDRIGALGHMGLQRIALWQRRENSIPHMMRLTKLAQQDLWVLGDATPSRRKHCAALPALTPSSQARFSLAEQAQWFHSGKGRPAT